MTEEFPRQIYVLSQRNLSPETIAVTFAKTSRSPQTFWEIADELSDETSAAFHEKWVVGYGHASVAEHAVLHIAFENVSRLAVECIESNRLASYTEKSTRYQKWDPQAFFVPPEVIGGPHETLYRDTLRLLFDTYAAALEPTRAVVREQFPPRDGESLEQWDNRIRSRYVDACRFLLPSASLANLGMTVNARALEHAIRKMLSHPLREVQEIGEATKASALEEVPTLVKYVEPAPFFIEAKAKLNVFAVELQAPSPKDAVQLIAADQDAEERVLAAALYEQSNAGMEAALAYVRALDGEKRGMLCAAMFEDRGQHDAPLRALEHATFSFDAVMDQGAYFEVKRHRMMTQSPGPLSVALGYATPRLISQAGFEDPYHTAMQSAAHAVETLAAWSPHVASYLVPNGYNRRVFMTLNLRQLYHFCELRSAKNAHFSVRRIARRMAELIQPITPGFIAHLRLPADESWRSIEEQYFTQV